MFEKGISAKVNVWNIVFLLKCWSIDKVVQWYLISDRQIQILYTVWTADRFTRWKTKSNVMQNRRNPFKKNRKAVLPPLSTAVWGSVELEKLLFWICAHGFRQGQARGIWTYHSSKFEIWLYHARAISIKGLCGAE